jgi:NitT/TauT family transport system ATP-binding protein
MHQQPPVVTFEMVEKRFGAGPLILDRVSFSAACGDFIALIGPSGCGKSTILKLIAGLIPRTSGRIIIRLFHLRVTGLAKGSHECL